MKYVFCNWISAFIWNWTFHSHLILDNNYLFSVLKIIYVNMVAIAIIIKRHEIVLRWKCLINTFNAVSKAVWFVLS